MSRIVLPLRSNAVWFTSEERTRTLERHLKTAAVLFDQLVIQDGRYVLTVWENGRAFDMFVPSTEMHHDRESVHHPSEGDNPLLLVDGHAFGSGPAVVNHEADFHVILARAGLQEAPFIELFGGDVTGEAKAEVARQIRHFRMPTADTPPRRVDVAVREKQLEALLIDAMIAEHFESPFATDSDAASILNAAPTNLEIRTSSSNLGETAYREWAGLGLPDFAAAPWEDVMKVRESAAGSDFRRMIERVVRGVNETVGRDAVDITEIVRREIVSELVLEVVALAPTLRGVAFNVAWGLVPGIGNILSAASDVRKVAEHQRSWMSLLGWKPSRGN